MQLDGARTKVRALFSLSETASGSRHSWGRGGVLARAGALGVDPTPRRLQYRGTAGSMSIDQRSIPPAIDTAPAKPRARSVVAARSERRPWWQ